MIEKGKPAPDIYLKASEIIGIQPKFCLALEDSPVGVLSAYNAGMKPVMIPDLIQPSAAIEKILYAKADNLIDVIGIIRDNVHNCH